MKKQQQAVAASPVERKLATMAAMDVLSTGDDYTHGLPKLHLDKPAACPPPGLTRPVSETGYDCRTITMRASRLANRRCAGAMGNGGIRGSPAPSRSKHQQRLPCLRCLRTGR